MGKLALIRYWTEVTGKPVRDVWEAGGEVHLFFFDGTEEKRSTQESTK